MSETPETDAFFFRTDIEWDDEVKFARNLERERDEARQLLKAATQALNAIHVEVGGWIGAMMKEGK
jgi:hypothetical protein